jgi:hypothetical protein
MTESELSARAKLANALNPFPFDNLPTDIFDNLWYTIANDYGLTLSEFMALKNARSAHITSSNLCYFSLYLILLLVQIYIVSLELTVAWEKISIPSDPISLHDLPVDRNDTTWCTIANDYGLSLSELAALKNSRCPHIFSGTLVLFPV